MRNSSAKKATYSMTLDQLYKMTFDFAVEDSPAAFEHLLHFKNCRVAVFERPWNKNAELPDANFALGKNWQEIDRMLKNIKQGLK